MSTRFRRSLSTLGCPALSLDEALALAERHGINALELRTLEGTMDIPALFGRNGEEAVRRVQRLHGTVQVLALSPSFKLVRPSETDCAALLSYVPWAEALWVPWLRIFDCGEVSDSGTIPLAAETPRWWRQLRSKHGWKVDVMVETHDGLVTHEAIRRYCLQAKDVAMLWDARNTWRKTGVYPVVLWPRIAEYVVHIHVKDSIGRASERLPYTFVLPGDGEFPMRRLADGLRRDGYASAVSLEWERQRHPNLPPMEMALQTAASRGWW